MGDNYTGACGGNPYNGCRVYLGVCPQPLAWLGYLELFGKTVQLARSDMCGELLLLADSGGGGDST